MIPTPHTRRAQSLPESGSPRAHPTPTEAAARFQQRNPARASSTWGTLLKEPPRASRTRAAPIPKRQTIGRPPDAAVPARWGQGLSFPKHSSISSRLCRAVTRARSQSRGSRCHRTGPSPSGWRTRGDVCPESRAGTGRGLVGFGAAHQLQPPSAAAPAQTHPSPRGEAYLVTPSKPERWCEIPARTLCQAEQKNQSCSQT